MDGRIEEMEIPMHVASLLIKQLLQSQDNMEAKLIDQEAAHAEITLGFMAFPKRPKVTTLKIL